MLPSRETANDADSITREPPISTVKGKRKRVSLACDACRSAREKCDSDRPQCGTCVSQSRACSYTPRSKKRGLQTGYLRTVEKSLAWVFDNFPDSEVALHHALTRRRGSGRGRDSSSMPGSSRKEGHRLHKRWANSSVNREIGRMLADCGDRSRSSNAESSAQDSEPESENDPELAQTSSWPPHAEVSAAEPDWRDEGIVSGGRREHCLPRQLSLPGHWRRLLEKYSLGTHCWLPIVDLDDLVSTATSYPPVGFVLDDTIDAYTCARHAQLWAALAVAAFQEYSLTQPSHHEADRFYSISCSILPAVDGVTEPPHICALILHTLVQLGRGNELSASLSVGAATRLALSSDSSAKRGLEATVGEDTPESTSRLLAACAVLDSLISIYSRQPPHLHLVRLDARSFPHSRVFGSAGRNGPWSPVSGSGPTPNESMDLDVSGNILVQPLQAFRQLYAFARILNAKWTAQLQPYAQTPSKVSADLLIQSLDPHFSFCNSLVPIDSMPMELSALVVQATFLTASLDLVTGHKASLASNLIEVITLCLERFGAGGSPPIMVTLLKAVGRAGNMDNLHDAERKTYDSALASLQRVWQPSPPETAYHQASQLRPVADELCVVVNPEPIPFEPEPSNNSGRQLVENTVTNITLQQPPINIYGPSNDHGLGHSIARQHPLPSPEGRHISWSYGARHSPPAIRDLRSWNQILDYNAALDELVSIDCADGMDVDPQFMANLGYTPGCDIGEIFSPDLGMYGDK